MNKIKIKSGFSVIDILVGLIVLGFVGYLSFGILLNYTKETKKNISQKESVQEYSYNSLWQSEYQTIDQATRMLLLNNNGSFENLCNDNQPNKCMKDIYSKNLGIVNSCDDNVKGRCWHNDGTWFARQGVVSNENIDSAAGLILNNGMLMLFNNVNTTCSNGYCGQIFVDVNGFEKPNTENIDIFRVNILKNSISQ